MIELNFSDGFIRLEKALIDLADKQHLRKAIGTALTRTAAASRTDIMGKLPGIFDRPTPFTVNSIRYRAANQETLEAEVYISEDAPKGMSPRNYLAPQINGGDRRDKRSERALKAAGLMKGGQQWVPGSGATLDRFGNISGPLMTKILSRLSAFGEQGYAANVADKTKSRLARAKKSARKGGTEFFVARSKADGTPLAIYHLESKGVVRPVLWFVNKKPRYQPRFHFHDLVESAARARFPRELMRALQEELNRTR